jgi:hypothetical protein
MLHPTPLPFFIKLPGEDTVDFTEIRDVERRADGLLHLLEDAILLEWAVTEKVEQVGLANISSTTETFAAEEVEIPLAWLASAELVGGILRPRLLLRARGLGVFAEIPGAKADRLELRYTRADRLVAVEMTRAISAGFAALPITEEQELITPGEVTPIP